MNVYLRLHFILSLFIFGIQIPKSHAQTHSHQLGRISLVNKENLEVFRSLPDEQIQAQLNLYQSRLQVISVSQRLNDSDNHIRSSKNSSTLKKFIFSVEKQITTLEENIPTLFLSYPLNDQKICTDFYQKRADFLRSSLERLFRLFHGQFETCGAPLTLRKLSPLQRAREALYFETWLLGQKLFIQTLILNQQLINHYQKEKLSSGIPDKLFMKKTGEVNRAEYIVPVQCLHFSENKDTDHYRLVMDTFKQEFQLTVQLEDVIENNFPRFFTHATKKISTTFAQQYVKEESPETIRTNALAFGASFFSGLGLAKLFSQALKSLPTLYTLFFASVSGISSGIDSYIQESKIDLEFSENRIKADENQIVKLEKTLETTREASTKVPQYLAFWDAYPAKELVPLALLIENKVFEEHLSAATQYQSWCQAFYQQKAACSENQLHSLELRYHRIIRELKMVQRERDPSLNESDQKNIPDDCRERRKSGKVK